MSDVCYCVEQKNDVCFMRMFSVCVYGVHPPLGV